MHALGEARGFLRVANSCGDIYQAHFPEKSRDFIAQA